MEIEKKLLFMIGGGFVACYGMAKAFQFKVSHQIKSTRAFQEAMEIVRKHEGAVYLLGQPITELGAKYNSLGPEFGYETKVKVHVSGPKSKGILFLTFSSEKDKTVDAIQLQIGNDDSKRLVIKKSSTEGNSGS